MLSSLKTLVFGRAIANRDARSEKFGVLRGVAAIGLDGLSSVAYGPEAMLTILAGTGLAGLNVQIGIAVAIVLLLTALYFSYLQTIGAYPSNGGAYVVASDNLGSYAGPLAAAALMIDYLLTVAVGISSGIGALISAVPSLHPYTLSLCLIVLMGLTLVNLRGTGESSTFLAIPTYLFIGSIGAMLAVAVAHAWASGGHPVPVDPPPPLPPATQTVGIWLLLRAFASGCTAMTGVEAVSNGVNSFREPKVPTARRTLTVIVVTLGVFLLALAVSTRAFDVMAMDQTQPGYQSVLSQLTAAVFGRGWAYYITIAAVLAVLCLSANTSYVGFPRLCETVAKDGYLPGEFAIPGRRLVYSAGIVFLTLGAGALLIGFDGVTDRLIPLFAVGAFLSFTLSQVGMAVHWRRKLRASQTGQTTAAPNERKRTLVRLFVNGFGALATGIALAIIIVGKFTEGAWIVIIAIPVTLMFLRAAKRFNVEVDRRLLSGCQAQIDVRDHTAPIVIVPIRRWDLLARKAVEYALRLSPDVTALHVTKTQGPDVRERIGRLKQNWQKYVEAPVLQNGLRPPRLEIVQSEYRSLLTPILDAVKSIGERDPHRPLLVVLPELVEENWWGYLMHTHREARLRTKLLQYGGPRISVVSVPWQLKPQTPDEGLQAENS
ncbi:APC family permease [Hyphomicrobium sp. 99]|uniref:APC family permease n=1 Tax=Hyphomicrobium sp. 99 TaxID=1163419 RepID=UPI0005F816AE|nr:APC family permease [Hyphomicrobium sp. 99]